MECFLIKNVMFFAVYQNSKTLDLDPLGRNIFLHRVNTSGVKISVVYFSVLLYLTYLTRLYQNDFFCVLPLP